MQKGMTMRKGAQIHVPNIGKNKPPKKTNTQNTPQEIIHTSGFGCRPCLLPSKTRAVSVPVSVRSAFTNERALGVRFGLRADAVGAAPDDAGPAAADDDEDDEERAAHQPSQRPERVAYPRRVAGSAAGRARRRRGGNG